MIPGGSASDFGVFAGAAAQIAEVPVERKPHEAKRTRQFNGLCAMADHHGWQVNLVHLVDDDMELPAWVLRVVRNPAGDPAHWQIASATSRDAHLRTALPLLVAAVMGKVARWS